MKQKTISERENYLRAVEYRFPEWIPVTFEFQPAVWTRYGAELAHVIARYPLVAGGHQRGYEPCSSIDPLLDEGVEFEDDWGCVWRNVQKGLLGRVVVHPLANWRAFDHFHAPEPAHQFNWEELAKKTEERRSRGLLTIAEPESFAQGGFLDRLVFLRGYENLMMDFLEEPPELSSLIDMLLDYNTDYLRRWLEIGVDVVWHHGDVGSQRGPAIAPDTFRKFLKPAYTQMFRMCRKSGSHVWYSSDGNLLALVDDLVECGVSIHDPQVRPNTIDGIRQHYQGRLCAMVDIDEQMLPFATQKEIDDQVREIVAKLGRPEGGLIIFAIPSQDVPIENIEALFAAWEEHCFHNWPP